MWCMRKNNDYYILRAIFVLKKSAILLLAVVLLFTTCSSSVNAEEVSSNMIGNGVNIDTSVSDGESVETKKPDEIDISQEPEKPSETEPPQEPEKPSETEPPQEPEKPAGTTEPNPLPMVLISRDDMKNSIHAGEELEITFRFQNLSEIMLESPVATFMPSESLMLSGGSTSFTLENLEGNGTASIKVKIKALKTVSSPNQFLNVQLKFNYDNGIALVQGTTEERIFVPAFVSEKPDRESPLPMVLVSRDNMKAPIYAGEEREVTFRFQNLSDIMLKSPVVTFIPSESLMLSDSSTSFRLGDLKGKETASIKVKIKALKTVSSPNQFLNVQLKFNYDNGTALVQGTTEERISIPVFVSEGNSQPIILVSHPPIINPISSGEAFDVVVTFKNAGKMKAISPVVRFSLSDSLMSMSESNTLLLNDMDPGGEIPVTVKLKAMKDISSSIQFLGIEMKYNYNNGSTIVQAENSDKINIPANVQGERMASSVPNIIICNYVYGEESIAAGSRFKLKFDFENTGKLKVENIVVAIDGGESFTADGVMNTYYYDALSAKGKETLEVPFQALASAKNGAQSIAVNFKYEYIDGNKRSSATAEIKLSVPVSQPDRFRVDEPSIPENIVVGQELMISIPYVNKGKSEISNVEAVLEENENVDSVSKTRYIGNIEAGKSGEIGFALTPKAAGDIEVLLKITYEDSNQKLQTKEFLVNLLAKENMEDDFGDMTEDTYFEEKPVFPRIMLFMGVAAILAGGIFIKYRMTKKKDELVSVSFDWDENDSIESDSLDDGEV